MAADYEEVEQPETVEKEEADQVIYLMTNEPNARLPPRKRKTQPDINDAKE